MAEQETSRADDYRQALGIRVDGMPGALVAMFDEQVGRVMKVADAEVARGQVQALREYAEELERELVCCDAYDGKGADGKHQICYWGGAAAAGARHQADEIERTL